MKVCLIAAMDRNRVIGKGQTIPWRLKTDMNHFKNFTMGKVIIMGRKTFESMNCKPLKGRFTIVISSNADYMKDKREELAEHLQIVTSFKDAIFMAYLSKGCFDPKCNVVVIVGGSQVYKEALPYVSMMCISHVEASVEGDVFFPEFDEKEWRLNTQSSSHINASEENEYPFDIMVYERRKHAQMLPL